MLKPRKIRLEAATVCQLRCPTCPTTSGEIRRTIGAGYLRLEEFKRLIDENPWVKHVELSNWGEIFLNPDLEGILEYADRRNVALHSDNGVNLNSVRDHVIEALVKYRIRSMTCSIDGASNETYSIYRKRGNFERVIDNIRKINGYKRQYNSKHPVLTWQFVVFGHNEHEIAIARNMARELNMGFYVKLTWDDDTFSPIKDKELVRRETGLGVATRSEYYQKYKRHYFQRGTCSQLWNSPQINWDGRVLGCCVNYWGDFGNAFQEGLLKSLNNEKIGYARLMLLGKREAREDIPCTTCHYYKEMKEDGRRLT
ncbi:MAG: radical SAM/SPASM domain-containing protein, partial [Terriglobia bacterium]